MLVSIFVVVLDSVYNAVSVAELTVEKGTNTVIGPHLPRRQLNEL